jgi:lipoprotein NlpI
MATIKISKQQEVSLTNLENYLSCVTLLNDFNAILFFEDGTYIIYNIKTNK